MKKLALIFIIALMPGIAHAVKGTLHKDGGTGTISGTGIVTAEGTAPATVNANGNQLPFPSASASTPPMTREGSTFTRMPLYMPGTTAKPPLGTGGGGITATTTATYEHGVWCTGPRGESTNGTSVCYAGNTSGKITGSMGTFYLVWSCLGGYHLYDDMSYCDETPAGYYSPLQDPNIYECPANNYCPKLSANPSPCPTSHPYSDPLSQEIGNCYTDHACTLPSHATSVVGRNYYGTQIQCIITGCETGYALIDNQCVVGCPEGQYLNDATCDTCPAGSYCLGGFMSPALCPTEFPNSAPGAMDEAFCYRPCPLSENATLMSGYDYYGIPSTCVPTACATNYAVIGGECFLSCGAGNYNNSGVCAPCVAGYYCPANSPSMLPCQSGYYCPAGVAAGIQCPETHPNSQIMSSTQNQCYFTGTCTLPANSTGSQLRVYSPNTTAAQGICAATGCIDGYALLDSVCVNDTNITTLVFNKLGGTGNIKGVTGTASATMNCDGTVCILPNVSLTRTNSTPYYSESGAHYAYGRWCTEPLGGGTCYEGGQTFTIDDDATLYAMWSCTAGYYSPGNNACVAAGAGYYSPEYGNQRIQCPAGTYCNLTTMVSPNDCPASHSDSDVGNTSIMTCRRDCTSMPGVADASGYQYYSGTDNCTIVACQIGWSMENGQCIIAECPAGYFEFASACQDCQPGNYCPGAGAPQTPCPASHPRSAAKNDRIETCYQVCMLAANSVSMTGRDYYDAPDTCMALGCMNGYDLIDGACVLAACPAGQFVNGEICDTCGVGRWHDGTPGGECTPVGGAYFSPANDARRYACPDGKMSGGDGVYAANIASCADYKSLMVYDGANTVGVLVRGIQMTTPALRIYDGNNIYYGNVSQTPGVPGKTVGFRTSDATYYLSDNLYSQ